MPYDMQVIESNLASAFAPLLDYVANRPAVDHGTLAAEVETFSVVLVVSGRHVQELSTHPTQEAAEGAMLLLESNPCGGERHLILHLESDECECCETCGRRFTSLVLDSEGNCGECGYAKAVLADGKQD